LVGAVEERIVSYVTGQLFLCLVIGVLAFIAYLLIGLPYALILALFAGVMEAVPLVGPTLGAIPALIVAFSISPLTALWVVVATIIIQQAENHLLVPRVMRRTLGVRPLVTLLALISFGTLFGIIGALVALPLAAVVQLLLDRSLLSSELERESTSGRDRATMLRYEAQELVKDIRNVVRTKEDVATAARDQIEDSIEAIALDLDSLLAQRSGNGMNGGSG
jgi:predicted PurR-regulated permease PerM